MVSPTRSLEKGVQHVHVRSPPCPEARNPGGNLTTEVRACSDTQARSLAAAQYPSYRVEAVRQSDDSFEGMPKRSKRKV